jgi:hypothetical protein
MFLRREFLLLIVLPDGQTQNPIAALLGRI